MNADGTGRTQIVTQTIHASQASWSPGADEVVGYGHPPEGAELASRCSALYRIPLGGGSPVQVTSGAQCDEEPAWSPDGKWIAFTRRDTVSSKRCAGCTDIWLVQPNGTGERRLTNPGRRFHDPFADPGTYTPRGDFSPAWSPDGLKVAFRRVASVDHKPGIWTVSVKTGKAERLELPDGTGAPDWSPDGRKLAMTVVANDRTSRNIAVFDLKDRTTKVLTSQRPWVEERDSSQGSKPRHQPVNDHARWSADGKRIAFHSNRDHEYAAFIAQSTDIYTIGSDGTNLRRITTHVSQPESAGATTSESYALVDW
jgi:Tol biopolymer transport system component